MPKGKFQNVRIRGVSTVVPVHSKSLEDDMELLGGPKNIEKLKRVTGLSHRRIASQETTSLDLCCVAANRILEALNEDRNMIDAVIFVTQTPDHRIPNNASLVHGRLQLNRDCLCYDVNHGCSGYLYGLLQSFSLVQTGVCTKVLLLVGDTLSKVINPKDKSLNIIHGDAGSATIIEYTEYICESSFTFYSDGTKAKSICIEAGGYRKIASPQTSEETMDSEGNIRSEEQLYMNGLEVFNFALQNVPDLVNDSLKYSGKSISDIDFFAFHQANGIINRGIADKLLIPKEKAPTDVIKEYGNTSCATVPHVLAKALGREEERSLSVMLVGFGVGLSLAACCTDLMHTKILPVIEYME